MNTHGSKTIIITGSNTGIGLAIAKHATLQKQRVILACRNVSKAESARQTLLAAAPDAHIFIRQLDLSSFDSIRHFAENIEKEFPSVDALINNAGLLPMNQQFTSDGFEMQFGVNYLSHFLLTHLLLPTLSKSPTARIVHLSSIGHYPGKIQFETFRGRNYYLLGLPSYAQSKLANVLFSHELSRRLPGHITSNAVHPGFVDTQFFRSIPAVIYAIWRRMLASPERCGRFIADMALARDWEGKTGKFVSAHGPLPISRKTANGELQNRLYEESCRLVGVAPVTA